ncbi:oligoendopeptidase F [bacterium]|nr:oligoendopeptidase F [bacterium]MCB9479427.1 oligoendopeptidase F [Deltaproteobacteria bacterium]
MISRRLRWLMTFFVAAAMAGSAVAADVSERKDIPLKYKWDLNDLYGELAAFQKAKAAFMPDAKKLKDYVGKLGESPQALKEALDLYWGLELRLRRMESYASRLSDQDTRDEANSAMSSEVQQMRTAFGEMSAYFEPEIIALGQDKVEKFMDDEAELKVYKRLFEETFRRQKHIRSHDEEQILAAAGDMATAGMSLFRVFANADMPRKEVTLSDGTRVKLTDSNFTKYRRHPNKADRDLISSGFFEQYETYKRTYAEMLYNQLKAHRFYANMRGYPSTLAAALDRDDIPVEIYSSLIEAAHKNLPTFHRYLKLKARAKGVKTLDYQDLYVSFTDGVNIEMPYDEATSSLIASVKPMGKEYAELLKTSFENRWIDVYPSDGKRSGAYSSGWAYDVHPYVLMNYNDEYSDALTLAHEMGHALHSHYSNKHQPLPNADYSIFVAEVASTFNENLFNDYMLGKVADDDERFYLLGNFLDGTIKGTFFRQIQFAEFEWEAHKIVESGAALSGEKLGELYLSIVRKYYGHDEGVVNVDDRYSIEWAYVPHFYYNYYVFQYATSVAAASGLAQQVINGEEGALERYYTLLKSGGADDPVTLLKTAGADMTQPAAYDALMQRANDYMDELEKILDKRGL